ncbi:MAG: UDP-N-acetylglucosamine 2-epimerase (non-hydrolyzing) [Dehalococcoidia bacterium]
MQVLVVIGTRPEAIKLAPVVKALRRSGDQFSTRVCVTSQHREMLYPILEGFKIVPDYDLEIMSQGQSLNEIAARIFRLIDPVLSDFQPDCLVVQGDTTTAMVASLAAFHTRVEVAHVEAGLRSHDLHLPFPEEMNRRVADIVSSYHFAPTETARQNLLEEGFSDGTIHVTGNTVIDALLESVQMPLTQGIQSLPAVIEPGRKTVLVTAHRRESFGPPLNDICLAIRDIAALYRDEVNIVFPVHFNPRVREAVYPALGDIENVMLVDPLDYFSFVHLMKASHLILTDSGGIQEEAPSLGVPVLVMRDVSERMEAVDAGASLLVGTDRDRIVSEVTYLLDDEQAYRAMASVRNPYGDGKASERIVEVMSSGLTRTSVAAARSAGN